MSWPGQRHIGGNGTAFDGSNLHGSTALTGTCLGEKELLVDLCIDGSRYVVGLHLDEAEHARRRQLGLGAATSTGLLHALWTLPHGLPVRWRAMSDMDRETLEQEGRLWIDEHGNEVVRRYQPPGAVRSIIVADMSLARAVSRVAVHPPTVRRIALWLRESNCRLGATPTLVRAYSLGVGVLATVTGDLHELVPAADAAVGLPAVFRWWQAELAYRNWLTNTEPTALAELSA